MKRTGASAILKIRNARLSDVPEISAPVRRVCGDMPAYTDSMLQGQIASFPEGQFLVEYEGRVVGYAAGFLIDEATALSPHTWTQITGDGYASRHDARGEWLYDMEVCVDPETRRLRIGQRL
jgi:ribosomal protein S18 acetylase RimI-like enzyme